MKRLSRLAFALLIVLMIVLAAATLLEKSEGSDFVARNIYQSGWFVALWGVLSLSALGAIRLRFRHLRPSVITLHGALLLILLGALLTFTTAHKGYLHLREGKAVSRFRTETDHLLRPIPFSLTLENFSIEYYPGTRAPADYRSRLLLSEGKKRLSAEVSMNRILSYRGWRFYQSSFDDDLRGSILSVNYDPYGIPVTYAGYMLLGLSMLAFLADKRAGFRQLLRHPLAKRTLLFGGLLFGGFSSLQAAPRTLTPETASAFGCLRISHGDRVVPLQTLARDFTLKIYGKPHYRNFSAEQVLCGWIFFPEEWQHEPMIRIKADTVRRLIGSDEYASFTDFFDSARRYKLTDFALHPPSDPREENFKAFCQANEKVQLIVMLQAGQLLKLFPQDSARHIRWLAPTDPIQRLPTADSVFIKGIFPLLYEAVTAGEDPKIRELIDKIDRFQRQRGGAQWLPERKLQAERLYNRLDILAWLYRLNLCAGLLAFLYFSESLLSGTRRGGLERWLNLPLWISFLGLSGTLTLRGYIAGHLPLSNGYETMMFIAWCVLLATFPLRKRFPPATASGLLLSGFSLLVASLGSMNPQITSLMPVLASPWLSIHVSLIMASYALFGFILLNSLIAMIILLSGSPAQRQRVFNILRRLQRLSRMLLYPAVFLLAAGIFIGAVWANVSWGRYWGWDPKEVWALITLMLYALPLHTASLPRFRNPFFFHTFLLWAFASVLMTYFGVNYFLGGVHSYAGELHSRSWEIFSGCGIVLTLLLTLTAHRAYRRYRFYR